MKSKIVSMMLALSLIVSGLPVNSVNATEIADNETEEAVIATESVDESGVAEDDTALTVELETKIDAKMQLKSVMSDYAELDISEDAKMAGSNGILYDDVMYLSTKTVMALDEDVQDAYHYMCDEISYYKEIGLDIQDTVIAVDADGNLHMSASVPMKVIDDIKAEMLEEITDKLDETVEQSENAKTEEESSLAEDTEAKEEASETEIKNEESSTIKETEVKEETSGTETEGKEPETEAITEEEPSSTKETETEEDTTELETETETSSAEETETEEEASEVKTADAEEVLTIEEAQTEESEEDVTETEEEETTEEYTLVAENMDSLAVVEEETFDAIEAVKVDNIIDLGYGNSGDFSGLKQYNSTLPTEDYFSKQLSAREKKFYDIVKARFLKGNNSFSFKGSLYMSDSDWLSVYHAVSAVVSTYPTQTDWIAKPGKIRATGSYMRGSSTADYTVTLDKSKYYSGSLNSKANSQIQKLAIAAQEYAKEYYPEAPVYGIVKYFDAWICENNYYEMQGTLNVEGLSNQIKKTYYYCHSAYGILLYGYGVCESYAKAMSRLLDAVGIPNVYVVGDAGGGHAWNYVQMPNGNWYMVDSTWNDTTNPNHIWSNEDYLLVPNDGRHVAQGTMFGGERSFSFPTLATAKYSPNSYPENIQFTTSLYDLIPNQKVTISVPTSNYTESAPKTWASSNTKVAKVDSKGNVTGVASGTAQITLTMAGMRAVCNVNVDQVKSVVSSNTKKNSETLSIGIKGSQGTEAEAKNVTLNIDMGNSPHTAKWMIDNGKMANPEISYSKQGVVTASVINVSDNQIALKIKPNTPGATNVKVKFAGKTVTVKTSVGKMISEDMFDVRLEDVNGMTKNGSQWIIPYTGKAVKPKVKKVVDEKVGYKVSYLNNKDAGKAAVKITGTGQYGGELTYDFTIEPISIETAEFSKDLKSKVYNGGANAPATTVKLNKKTLKANRDYKILYNGKDMTEITALPVGTYTITIEGMGNYVGKVSGSKTYEVKENTIAKVTASCASTVKYTGLELDPVTVKIGKNVLPEADYKVVYHIGSKDGAVISKPFVKGKYAAVITVNKPNLTTTAKKTQIVKNFTVK